LTHGSGQEDIDMKADREILGDSDVAERLRAAAESATHGLEHHHHQNRRAAANYRARQAREWARSQWGDLKDGVERRPYSATAWALGIGLLTGVLLTTLMRTSHRDY
jgi:hypothetical protein